MDDKLNQVVEREKSYWIKAYRDQGMLDDWYRRTERQISNMFGNENRISFWLEINVPGNPVRVLDAGCGTGTFAMSWSCFFPDPCEIYGIDINSEALSIARMKADLKGNYPVVLVKGSVDDLPWADGFFDIVHSADLLEHLPDTKKAISELMRVTKDHGYFFTHVPDYRTGFEPHLKMKFKPPTREGLEALKKRVERNANTTNLLEDIHFLHPAMVEEIILNECPSVLITRIFNRTRPFWKKTINQLRGYKYDILAQKVPLNDH